MCVNPHAPPLALLPAAAAPVQEARVLLQVRELLAGGGQQLAQLLQRQLAVLVAVAAVEQLLRVVQGLGGRGDARPRRKINPAL